MGKQSKEAAKQGRVVALRHNSDGSQAPGIVAKGRGDIGQRILAIAAKHKIPVREDPDLLELLTVCEVGEEIPVELYSAVAQLLAYLYRVNEGRRAPPTGGGDVAP